MDVYRFPATRFVQENGFWTQLKHVKSEIVEIENTSITKFPGMTAEEILDAIHSLETLLRICEKENPNLCVEDVAANVERKNKARGYYK